MKAAQKIDENGFSDPTQGAGAIPPSEMPYLDGKRIVFPRRTILVSIAERTGDDLPPDWRWRRYRRARERGEVTAGDAASEVAALIRLGLDARLSVEETGEELDPAQNARLCDAVRWALCVRRNYGPARWQLEARILSGEQEAANAQHGADLRHYVFHELFFDVRGRREHADWVIREILVPAALRGPTEDDFLWKGLAWKHGERSIADIHPLIGDNPSLELLCLHARLRQAIAVAESLGFTPEVLVPLLSGAYGEEAAAAVSEDNEAAPADLPPGLQAVQAAAKWQQRTLESNRRMIG